MSTTLRLYQQTAVDAIESGWLDARRQLLVMPTGTGKTQVFITVAERARGQGRTLILAHREELLDQARDRIATWTSLDVAIEKAEQRADGLFGQHADVVVASVQTMVRRLHRYPKDAFALVVVDEAHHAPADSYQAIVNHFDARLLGVTATPDRLDRKSLKGTFDAVPYVYEIGDAIRDGWLVPIRQKVVQIKTMDLGFVRTTAGDLNAGDLELAMFKPEILHGIARATVESAGDRRTLIFTPTVGYAKALAEAMVAKWGVPPGRILALSGDDDTAERRAGVAAFRRGDVQYMANCALFTEGFDVPEVALVAVARPTKSRGLYTQMVGRGTRTVAGKRDLLVLDFVGNAERHSLVNVMDILGGGTDDEIKERAKLKIAKGETDDVLEALRQAREELADFYRRQALEAAKRAAEAHIEYKEVDPFRRICSILKIRPAAGRMGGVESTEEQLELLRQHKVHLDMPDVRRLDRGQASEILAKIRERPRIGLCTYKMARTLIKFGFDPDVPYERASEIIGLLRQYNWQRPPEAAMARVLAGPTGEKKEQPTLPIP